MVVQQPIRLGLPTTSRLIWYPTTLFKERKPDAFVFTNRSSTIAPHGMLSSRALPTSRIPFPSQIPTLPQRFPSSFRNAHFTETSQLMAHSIAVRRPTHGSDSKSGLLR